MASSEENLEEIHLPPIDTPSDSSMCRSPSGRPSPVFFTTGSPSLSPAPRRRAHTISSSHCLKDHSLQVDLQKARINARLRARKSSVSPDGRDASPSPRREERASSEDRGRLAKVKFREAVHHVICELNQDKLKKDSSVI